MPWDMKLGLLAGAGVVVAVALVFHRPVNNGKDESKGKKPATAQRAASLSPMLPAGAVRE